MIFDSHVGVLAFPFGTHAAPLLALVKQLAASTPRTCFSFFNCTADSNPAILADNIRVYQVWDGTPPGQPFTGTHFEAIALFLEASPGNFDTGIEEAERNTNLDVCCLISDAFLWFVHDLAWERGVPWLPFWTAASCSLSAHAYTDQILKAVASTGTGDEDQQVLSFIPPGLPRMLQVADLPPEIFLDRNQSPLALTINKMVEKLPEATAVVVNSFEEMDPIFTQDLKSKFKHVLNVGPLSFAKSTPPGPDDKTGCLSWLENQSRPRSVIYISFGTVIVPPENELLALAEALEACKFPFVWSIKGRAQKSLPEGFLQRTAGLGKIVPWAPQPYILGHGNVGAFVTHCGWNSILESISGSVPMICRPFFGDQKLNSIMVEDSWKIGVRVKGGVLDKSETMEALKRVMSSEGNAMRENIFQLKQRASSAVKADGSSTKNLKKLLEIMAK